MQRWFRQHRAIVLNTYIRRYLLRHRSYSTRTAFFNKNPTQSLPEKLSTYFSNLLTEQHDKMLDHPVQGLIDKVPNLARDLRKSMDIENKLFTVLSYDPVMIDPRLYLHFYDPTVTSSVKKLMLERLLYHQQYSVCWQLFLGDTLDDLDLFLETTKRFMKKQRNDFAVIDLIINMPDFGENEAYRSLVLDALTNTFDIDARHLLQTYSDVKELRNINDLLAFPRNDFISTALCSKQAVKVLYNEGTTAQQFQEILLQTPDLIIRPGWISFVLPKFEFWSCMVFTTPPPRIIPFIDAIKVILSRGVRLTDMDTLYMLHSDATPFSIFLVYKLSPMQKLILNYLIKVLVNESNHEELKAAYLSTRRQLELPVVISCVNKLLLNEPHVLPLLKQLEKSTREKVVLGLSYPSASHYMELIIYFNNNQKIARHLITKFSSSPYSNVENLTSLAASNINSKRTLLEIFRSTLLRAQIVDADFISVILNVILRKTVPNKGDFKRSFDALDHKQKSIVHNTFRSIGQTLSLLDETHLASALDAIYNAIHSESFYYNGDKSAQQYLLKLISNEAFRFIMRKDDRVQILQTTMGQMNTPTFWVKYWLIYSMVIDDFSNAIKLLEFYQKSKRGLIQFFPAMVLGIIQSQQMDINGKVKYIDHFLKQAKKLQYQNVLKYKAGMEIISRLQKASKNGVLNDESIKLLTDWSQKNRYVRRAIKITRRSRN
uniref:Orf19.3202 n=1 Tax=Candida metapsilosis TaxID=273372 RepID=F1D917_9ASCO|nr:orf19.3202 [Candida metapsilosis]